MRFKDEKIRAQWEAEGEHTIRKDLRAILQAIDYWIGTVMPQYPGLCITSLLRIAYEGHEGPHTDRPGRAADFRTFDMPEDLVDEIVGWVNREFPWPLHPDSLSGGHKPLRPTAIYEANARGGPHVHVQVPPDVVLEVGDQDLAELIPGEDEEP